jgi:hypothetical protein
LARNAELNPKPAVKRPDTTSKRVESIPDINVHGHKPNFVGEPNNPGDTIDIGQSGVRTAGSTHELRDRELTLLLAKDVELGFPSGRGVPTFPPNYERGTDLGPALGNGAELKYGTDIICDPADMSGICDPTTGWSPGS